MDPNATLWHQRALPQTGTPSKPKSRNRTWDENYQALLKYKSEHNDCMVPHKYEKDRVLSKWCCHLRENYHSGQLLQDRVEALEAIGFVWSPHELKWNLTYQRLVEFWKENGHSKVPTVYKPDPALGKWVSRQREDYSGGYISEQRRKKLDALGFVWRISKKGGRQKRKKRPDDDRWQQRYQELVEFHQKHGHANVPRPDSSTDKLAGWVGVQRCNYSRGLMPQERIDLLKKVDFIFNFNQVKKQEEWNKMYELLKLCRKTDGGFKVSVVGDDSSSLSRWMQRQREKHKLYKLEPGREILLRKLNFSFPERPPREEKIDDNEHSEGLEKALAEIDNARPEDLFGTDEKRNQRHTGGNSSMVEAIIDLAGEDKDLGKQVGESIGVLSKFMSISPEELATRMSAPLESRSRSSGSPTVQAATENAFSTLMPLIVSLRETGDEAAVKDCVNFLARMIQQSKAEGVRKNYADDPDPYNALLNLAVEFDLGLDKSARSDAVVQSCAMYIQHMLTKLEREGKVPAGNEPVAKKARTSRMI